jgi:hypothetical protein
MGQAHVARHIIHRICTPVLLMASYDVAINVYRPLNSGPT